MARRTKNVVDYFPHNVTHGKSIEIIESKFSHLGYAFFFKILEFLGKSENHYLDLRDEIEFEYIVAKIGTDTETAVKIFDLMAKVGSIDKDMWKNKVIFSQNFIDNIKDVYERRKSMCMNKSDICNHLKLNVCINRDNDDISTQRKVEDRKLKETKAFIQRTKDLNSDIGLNDKDIEKFNLYWTASGEKDKKLHFEKQKTFDHKKRMATWKLNSRENYKPVSTYKPDHSLTVDEALERAKTMQK